MTKVLENLNRKIRELEAEASRLKNLVRLHPYPEEKPPHPGRYIVIHQNITAMCYWTSLVNGAERWEDVHFIEESNVSGWYYYPPDVRIK